MSKFNYITNYISGTKTAKMYIRKPITEPNQGGVSGEDFAREIEYLAAEGVDEVVIDINSVGGSIKEGFTIYTAIKDAPMKTTTRVIGIAASMAGIISQAGDKRVIVDYGIFHAHGPQSPDGSKVDKKILDIMLGSLKTMISVKANLTEAQVADMLSKETILTAVEALQMGLFDEIEETIGVKPVFKLSNGIEELFTLTNTYINKREKMEELQNFLGLENATELDIINSLKVKEEAAETSKNKIEELENALTEKSAEFVALEAKVTELKSAAATKLVSDAVTAGKISEESREKWLKTALNDLGETEELLNGIVKQSKSVSLKNAIAQKVSEDDARKDWDFQKYSQEDPTALEQIKADNPELFEKMLNEYIDAK